MASRNQSNIKSCRKGSISQWLWFWAVVVAQLVERSLLTPEIRDSNPVISEVLPASHVEPTDETRPATRLVRRFTQHLHTKFATNCTTEKTKIKKRGRERPIFF